MQGHQWMQLDGRRVQRANFPIAYGSCGVRAIGSPPNGELILHAEYLGDRTEAWIVVYRDGKEVARHNAQMFETIVWEPEAA